MINRDRFSPRSSSSANSPIELIDGGVRIFAPAKINLNLLVGPMYVDASPVGRQGFHPVDSIVAKITFCDAIELAGRDDGQITLDCRGADCGPEQKNLAYRAAGLMLPLAPGRGVGISLTKRIPTGAGLGGGSSDAAAVLRGLNELWNLHLPVGELMHLGAKLGSDVPLFLGGPCSRVTGRGEIVASAKVYDFHAVLVLPDAFCPTPAVYRAYDSAPRPIAPQLDENLLANEPPSHWSGLLQNDLAAPAAAVSPAFAHAWNMLKSSIAPPVHVSGSGCSMFILCDDPDDAQRTLEMIPPALRSRSLLVRRNDW